MANAMANVDPVTKNKRTKGTGTIYQRASDGMWCASLDLPPVEGTKRRRKVIVRAKKADVVDALREARKELERTGDLPTSSPTLAVWLDLWMTRIAGPRLKVSTRPTYRSKIENYIKPSIGRIRLDKLTPAHVQQMRTYVTETKGLSSTTALQAHRVLAKALTDAVREGRINRNVATLTDAPRKAIVKKRYLDGDQARTLLLTSAENPVEAAAWSVALLAGLRPGERLGLTRSQLDFGRSIIVVSWQLQRLEFEHGCGTDTDGTWPCGRKRGGNCPDRRLDVPSDQEVRHLEGGLYLTRPKSRAGWREVPMAPALHAILQHLITEIRAGEHDLVFTRDGSRPIDPRDDSRAWHAALTTAALPPVTRHSARHTCNTLLDELGVAQNVREQILGHAGKEANDIYTHVADVRSVDALTRLGELLSPTS